MSLPRYAERLILKLNDNNVEDYHSETLQDIMNPLLSIGHGHGRGRVKFHGNGDVVSPTVSSNNIIYPSIQINLPDKPVSATFINQLSNVCAVERKNITNERQSFGFEFRSNTGDDDKKMVMPVNMFMNRI